MYLCISLLEFWPIPPVKLVEMSQKCRLFGTCSLSVLSREGNSKNINNLLYFILYMLKDTFHFKAFLTFWLMTSDVAMIFPYNSYMFFLNDFLYYVKYPIPNPNTMEWYIHGSFDVGLHRNNKYLTVFLLHVIHVWTMFTLNRTGLSLLQPVICKSFVMHVKILKANPQASKIIKN